MLHRLVDSTGNKQNLSRDNSRIGGNQGRFRATSGQDPDESKPAYSLIQTPHRCFCIPELIMCIFEFLPRKDMIIASLVCKAWHGWVYRLCWGAVSGVTILELLSVIRISCGCQVESDTSLGNNSNSPRHHPKKIPNNVTLEEWNRFLYAFRHVKNLKIIPFNGLIQAAGSLRGLQNRFGGKICPNFQDITVGKGAEFIWGIPPELFISERLLSITMTEAWEWRSIEPSRKTTTFLKYLSRYAINLRKITITATFLDFAFDSFSSLSTLRIEGTISSCTLNSILKCKSLQQLYLRNCKLDNRTTHLHLDQATMSLDALQELELWLDQNAVHRLEESISRTQSLPALSKASVSFDQQLDWDKLVSLLQRLISISPHITEISLVTLVLVPQSVLSSLIASSGLQAFRTSQVARKITH
ncbi:hypothetical protein FRC03_002301, partial [Tulasnella sp. 419]